MKVIVIGSGLSSIGAIKALVQQGIKPIVLDVGKELEKEKFFFINNLSKYPPIKWSINDRETLTKNETVTKKGSIPKKFLFGSDYFYGKSLKCAKIKSSNTELPPFSYAKGGLSAGWGAAVLPPSKFDFEDWPIDIQEIYKYFEIILKELPYSAKKDGLDLNFPIIKEKNKNIKLSKRSKFILDYLKKKVKLKKDKILYGEARLLTDSDKCEYCGECMSGCVYNAIYKSSDDIYKLIKEKKIDYISGALVTKFTENEKDIEVEYIRNNQTYIIKSDKLFIGAGTVNTSRIVLNSLKKYNTTVSVKTRGGFVIPVFSIKSLDIDWPNVNTQPSLFLEFRGDGLKHWIHTQIALDNELLLKMLGLRNLKKGVFSKLKKWIANHTYLLLVNYHSNHSGIYKLTLDENNVLYSEQIKSAPQIDVWIKSWWKLFKILIKISSIPLYAFSKLNSGSYHVGGTFPMKKNPNELETDILGRINGLNNVHIIDSSIFPSLPGTTIGLLMMANSYRITQKVIENVKNS